MIPAWPVSYSDLGGLRKALNLALRRGLYSAYFADMEQHYFLNGCRYANSYLRFENLQEDYAKLCREIRYRAKRIA